MAAAAASKKEPSEVRPDHQTKSVSGVAYVVMLGVLIWMGSSLDSIQDKVTRLEAMVSYMVQRDADHEARLRALEQENKK